MKEENNFTRVLEYLRNHDMIRNQKDLAMRLHTTETTITRNKKGNVKHPDEETLHHFNLAFGDIINMDYLRGESDVMLVADLQQEKQVNTNVNPCKKGCPANCANLIQATIEAKNDAIMALKHEIAVKDDIIVAKDNLIRSLQNQIQELHMQYVLKETDTHGYYPTGTAEEDPEGYNSV